MKKKEIKNQIIISFIVMLLCQSCSFFSYMTFMDDEVVFPQVIETRYDKNRLEYISSSCEYIKDNPKHNKSNHLKLYIKSKEGNKIKKCKIFINGVKIENECYTQGDLSKKIYDGMNLVRVNFNSESFSNDTISVELIGKKRKTLFDGVFLFDEERCSWNVYNSEDHSKDSLHEVLRDCRLEHNDNMYAHKLRDDGLYKLFKRCDSVLYSPNPNVVISNNNAYKWLKATKWF